MVTLRSNENGKCGKYSIQSGSQELITESTYSVSDRDMSLFKNVMYPKQIYILVLVAHTVCTSSFL